MDAEANIGVADGPEGEARDALSQRRPEFESLPAKRKKPALMAGFLRLAGRLGFEPR